MSRRRCGALAALLVTLTTAGTTACSTTIPASQVLGPDAGVFTVLADSPALPAVRCAMNHYALTSGRGIKLGAATPALIASAVKDGEPTDVVVLPAGAALNQVRDELATPPARIALTRDGTTWWVAAVTDKGLAPARFLSSIQGRRLLDSSHCTASASEPTT